MNVQASLHKRMAEPMQVRINGKVKKVSTWDAVLMNLRTKCSGAIRRRLRRF